MFPSLFAHFGAVRPLKEYRLVRENEVGAGLRRYQLKRAQSNGDALTSDRHSRSDDDPAVGDDVVVSAVVRKFDPGKWSARFEAKERILFTSDLEVHFEFLNVVMIAFSEPAPFPGWLRECCEDAFRSGWVVAFDNERVVSDGLIVHVLSFL